MKGFNGGQQDIFMNYAVRCKKRGWWRDNLPSKTWVSAGDDEVLFVHDIEDFVWAARDELADVTLEMKPGGRHAWQTGAARPHHASFLDSEPGTECEGMATAWKDLTAAIVATFKSSSCLDEGSRGLVDHASRDRRVKHRCVISKAH